MEQLDKINQCINDFSEKCSEGLIELFYYTTINDVTENDIIEKSNDLQSVLESILIKYMRDNKESFPQNTKLIKGDPKKLANETIDFIQQEINKMDSDFEIIKNKYISKHNILLTKINKLNNIIGFIHNIENITSDYIKK